MALSQVQCLDNNNVNWRSSESKPEFFYSEEQRLALEALVSKGADAFYEVLKKENIRDFLSELELEKILEGVEPFDPGSSDPKGDDEGIRGDGSSEGDGEGSMSLQYWPQRSDHSIPELDMGWPETVAYRGVTRATVYMQPPLEGQAHIKEVIRKMIVNAQKVVAVVMDIFTDVDIFKDMLDAGFKRRVSIYIILDESNVKYFLQMCQRARMHEGQLKNLRVQCIGGTEFQTRFSTKFRGALTQKFIFVDGDKAACGSYSFTWSAARTDRNVLTVLTGQVVESFDKQFQELYLMSKAVSLKSVTIEPEPQPEHVTQPTALPTAVAKKIVNPKYALVKTKDSEEPGAGSSGNQSAATGTESSKKPKPKPKEPQPEVKEPNLHPALQDMEKANMFDYLPTWVEPEPESGSDVLGYINIIDPNIKNAQLSQMNRIKICDTSHATAQHMMMQNKEQEAREQQARERQASEQQAREQQARQKKQEEQKPVDRAGTAQKPVKIKAPKSPKKEKVIPEPIKKEEKLTNSLATDTLEVKTPDRSPGAFAFLAGSQHLVASENESEGTGKDSSRPVPKPRTVPVKDCIGKNNEQSQVHTQGQGEQTSLNNSRPNTPKSPRDVRTPNGTHRTHDSKDKKKDQCTSATQNGVIDDDDDDEEYVSLSEHGSSSDGSAHANHCQSNTSSNSEEYVDVASPRANKAYRRSNSELVPNGNPAHFQRMLSDSHVSRRSYVSPLKDVQIPLELRMEENGRRRNQALEEEIRRALDRTNKPAASVQGNDRIYSNDADQAKSLFQYRSRTPRSTIAPNTDREGYHGNQQDPNQRHNQFRMDTANEMDGYRHPGPNAGPGQGDQMYWGGQDYGRARTGSPNLRRATGSTPGHPSQFPEHQGGMDSFNTPFGIPYSKLSESKHLKSRMGGQGDFRRRGHKDH